MKKRMDINIFYKLNKGNKIIYLFINFNKI